MVDFNYSPMRIYIISTIFFLFFSLSISAIEEGKATSGNKPAGVEMLEKQIAELHERIYFLLRERPKKKSKNKGDAKDEQGKDDFERLEIRLGIGLNNRLAASRRTVFKETAMVELEGDTIKRIEFFYERTDTNSLMVEKRRITNDNVKNEGAGHVRVVTDLSLDKKDFTINELETAKLKRRFLTLYRNYLERLHKHFLLTLKRASEKNRVKMMKILKFDQNM